MCDGLDIRGPRGGVPPRPQPIADRLLVLPSLAVMIGERFRLGLDQIREFLFQGARDGTVQLSAPRLEQTRIGSIPDEGVLERVDSPRRLAAAEQQLRMNELAQRLVQLVTFMGSNGAEEFEGEFPSDGCADLG